MKAGKALYNFITKETKEQNRSKKVIVLMRAMCLVVLLSLVVSMLFCPSTRCFMGWMYYFTAALLMLMMFGISYFSTTTATLWAFNAGMLVWIASSVHNFGWEEGTQSYLAVLLILCFFSTYQKRSAMWFMMAFFAAIHVILYNVFRFEQPILTLKGSELLIAQIVNTTSAFGCIAIVANSFSRDTQKMEGKLVDYNNRLQKQANTDELTGLYNRRKAMEYLENEARNAQNDLGFSLCICDIDFFKKYNDRFGHPAGDKCLKEVAHAIKNTAKRSVDITARTGGEEFIIFVQNMTEAELVEFAMKVRKSVADLKIAHAYAGVSEYVTVSMGIAYGVPGEDYAFDDMYEEADRALYKAKNSGRNCIVCGNRVYGRMRGGAGAVI